MPANTALTLRIEADGYQPSTQPLTIAPGEALALPVVLTAIAPAAPASAAAPVTPAPPPPAPSSVTAHHHHNTTAAANGHPASTAPAPHADPKAAKGEPLINPF